MVEVADAKLSKSDLENGSGHLIMEGCPEDTFVRPMESLGVYLRAHDQPDAAMKLTAAGYPNLGAILERWRFEDPYTSVEHEGLVWVPRPTVCNLP